MCLSVVAKPTRNGRIILESYQAKRAESKAKGYNQGFHATGDEAAHRGAVPAHHARGQGRGRRGPVDDAGAVSVVPADPPDREARLARAADLRREPGPSAHRRRR